MISLPHKPILGFGTKNIQQFSSSISKVQSLQIPFFYFLLSVMLSIFWDLMHLFKENGILLLEFSFLINPTTGSHSQNDSWLMGISGSKSCSCERSWWKYQFWYDTFVSVGNYLPDNFDMNMIYLSLSLYYYFFFGVGDGLTTSNFTLFTEKKNVIFAKQREVWSLTLMPT